MNDEPDRPPRSIEGNVACWTRVNREYGDASAERLWRLDASCTSALRMSAP